jgi:hypothetical protein
VRIDSLQVDGLLPVRLAWLAPAALVRQPDSRAVKDALAFYIRCRHRHQPLGDDELRLLLHRACALGDTTSVSLLLRMHGARLDPRRTAPHRIDAMGIACSYGNLAALRLLVDRYNLLLRDARRLQCYALRMAVAHGHHHVLQYLLDRFHITVTDFREANNFALRMAAKHGHRAVLKLLLERLPFQRSDLAALQFEALRSAAVRGHHAVVHLLLAHFEPGPELLHVHQGQLAGLAMRDPAFLTLLQEYFSDTEIWHAFLHARPRPMLAKARPHPAPAPSPTLRSQLPGHHTPMGKRPKAAIHMPEACFVARPLSLLDNWLHDEEDGTPVRVMLRAASSRTLALTLG